MNQFNNKVQSESNLGVGTKSTKENPFLDPTTIGQIPASSPKKNNLHSLPFLERRSKQVHHISELMQNLFLSMQQGG